MSVIQVLIRCKVQNRALRIVTSCHSNTPISQLHHETVTPLVRDHLEMLSAQFLLSSSRLLHPCHQVVQEPPGRRPMKATLASKHSARVGLHLTSGVLDPALYGAALKSIHTDAVNRTIASLNDNVLLDAPFPPIASSEKSLTRLQRSSLSQLCSSQCHLLPDAMIRRSAPSA